MKTQTRSTTRNSVGTRTLVTGAFFSVGAVLVGWQFAAAAFAPTALDSAPILTDNSTASGGTGTSPVTGTDATTGSGTASTKDGTFTGSSVSTPFGSVQVAVTVSGGSISDVSALRLTDQGGRSVQISNYAAPILRSEVLQSQSAQVSMVSGATYTSSAYLQSLQSALDQVGN